MEGAAGGGDQCATMAAAVLALALLLAAGAYTMDEDMAELARMLRENCVEETGVDVAIIDSVNGGADLPEDALLKCYMKCVMETAGMFADGVVDVEAVLAVLDEPVRARNEPVLRACGTRAGADHCDTAYRTQLCWQQANKPDYYLV